MKAKESPPLTMAAFQELLDRLESTAFDFGALAERARITFIMNSPNAAGRLALAWRLAEAGLSHQAAEEALLVEKLGSAFLPVDAGASLSH